MEQLSTAALSKSTPTKSTPTLAQLKIFLAVAKAGSFTEAGLELSMTQSAVSHSIATFENNLNAKLFNRGRHGADLTPLGTKVLIHCKKAIQSLEAIEQEIAFDKGELIGTLRIAAFRSIAAHLLPSIIAWFKNNHPKVNIVVLSLDGDYGWIEKQLLEKHVDVGITAMPLATAIPIANSPVASDNPSYATLKRWNIVQDDFVILADQEQAKERFEWHDLQTDSLLLGGDDCTHLFLEHCRNCGYEISDYNCIPDDSVALSMVEHSLGLSIRPRLAAEPLPEHVKPYALPTPLARTIGVTIVPDAIDSPLIATFVNAIRDKELLSLSGAVQKGILRLC